LIRELLADPKVAVTRGRTADNADHLAPAFLDQIVRRYDGTRLGRQELDGELLDDMPGALWTHGLIDAARVATHPDLIRIVVAIDPAASSSETADETGIIVAGRDAAGHGYVLADASNRYAPAEWAKAAVIACRTHHADRIVAEVNNGGEMVEAMLRMTDPNVPFAAVHAAHGKVARAEPVAALYEQGRVHHIGVCLARGSDVRLLGRFRPRARRLFARSRRRPGLGPDRAVPRTAPRRGRPRILPPAGHSERHAADGLSHSRAQRAIR